jgi:hypothetical protein
VSEQRSIWTGERLQFEPPWTFRAIDLAEYKYRSLAATL